MNGYNAFEPPGNRELGALGRRLPRPYAVRRLRGAGVRWVVIHLDRLQSGPRLRIESEPLPDGMRLVADLGEDRIYEIERGGAIARAD